MDIHLHRILCPIDFSRNAAYATRYALGFAEAHEAQLLLLHVDEPSIALMPLDYPGIEGIAAAGAPEDSVEADGGFEEEEADMDGGFRYEETKEDDSLQRLSAELQERHESIRVSPLRASGKPFAEIVRMARVQDVDLIVMGTHGRTGLAHVLIGSTAEKVVRLAPCPVLTVKHPEQKFIMP